MFVYTLYVIRWVIIYITACFLWRIDAEHWALNIFAFWMPIKYERRKNGFRNIYFRKNLYNYNTRIDLYKIQYSIHYDLGGVSYKVGAAASYTGVNENR